MLEVARSTLLILSALFPIVNPLGGSPVFLALTRDYPASARRVLARQVAINSREAQKKVHSKDISRSAFYPLTLPLTVGPGSISIAITLGANEPRQFGSNLLAILAAVIASALVAVSIYLCYGFAGRLAAIIGESGMSIILRLSAFLLVCIGVQIFWNGASALLRSLPPGLR